MINLLDFIVTEFGFEQCISNKVFDFTKKDCHLIHFILNGEGFFEFKKKKFNLKKGDLFYIAPNDFAKYYPDKHHPWQYIWVGFKGASALSLLQEAKIGKNNPVFIDSKKEIHPLIQELYLLSQNKKSDDNLYLTSIIYKIFYYIINSNINLKIKLKSKETLVNGAKDFIRNNYQFDIKISDIANNLAITPEYLSKIFKTEEGKTPVEYLNEIRMIYAKSLLKESKLTINEISKKVGYQSIFYFSRQFKKYNGISPMEYKKLNLNEGGNL